MHRLLGDYVAILLRDRFRDNSNAGAHGNELLEGWGRHSDALVDRGCGLEHASLAMSEVPLTVVVEISISSRVD